MPKNLTRTRPLLACALVVGGACVSTEGLVGSSPQDDAGVGDSAEPRDGAANAETGGADASAEVSYAEMVKADGPIAYWRLGDAVNPAKDEMDAHPGAYQGGVQREQDGALAGDPDLATSFVGGRVEIPDHAALDLVGTSFTIELWIRPEMSDADGLYRGVIVKRDTNTSPSRGFAAIFAAAYEGFHCIIYGGNGGSVMVAKRLAFGVFSHLAVTFDVATRSARLYVNGELADSTGSMAGSVEDTNDFLAVGATSPSTDLAAFTGTLDEVAIYAKELAASTIKRHYDKGVVR